MPGFEGRIVIHESGLSDPTHGRSVSDAPIRLAHFSIPLSASF